MAEATNVDEYLAGLPDDQRTVLQQLRERIQAAAPQATETIAYDMPAYRLDGRFLLSFAAYRRHCSLFPASEAVQAAMGDAAARYVAGKGTLHFTTDAPIPAGLVRKLVKARVREVERR